MTRPAEFAADKANVEKACTKCGETKPLASFNRHSKSADGFTWYCKSCMSAYHKAHWEATRSERAATLKQRQAAIQADTAWFWSQVEVGDCWEWMGLRQPEGYGRTSRLGVPVYAHRFSWTVLVGEIPAGMQLDHLCRNRLCVNPDHLEPVTCRVNVLRGVGPSAQAARRTHCPQGHPYNDANTYWRPDGKSRQCRACWRVGRAS